MNEINYESNSYAIYTSEDEGFTITYITIQEYSVKT